MVTYKSFPTHTPHFCTEKELERRINELIGKQYDVKKEIATPYPNKEVKVLRLTDIPSFHDYIGIELRVTRKSERRKTIRVNCTAITHDGGSWGLAMMETRKGEREYDYFNKLLVEANL